MANISDSSKQLNRVLKIVCCVILMIAAGYKIFDLSTIHVLYDEFGYTATAAYYNGYDWSSVAEHSAYYSYGLGLLLAVIMRISNGNMILYYRLCIGMNILLLVISFIIACEIGKKLFDSVPEYIVILAAFGISFYSNTLVQTNILWTETLLYFLFWVSCWLLLKAFESSKLKYFIGLAVCNVYMYMVHQRTLAIIIASFMIVVGWGIIKKEFKSIIFFNGILLVCLYISYLLKSDVQNNLWGMEILSKDVNDYGGQLSKVIEIITSWEGMKAFLLSFSGKVYYIFAASLMIVNGHLSGLGQLIKEKKSKDLGIYIYIILCLCGAIGISAIFMLHGNRQDTLIYGRYTEYVIGPVLLIGLLFLWEHKVSKKVFALTNIGFVVASVLVYIKLRNTGFTVYNLVCAVGLSKIFKDGQAAGMAPLYAMVAAISVGIIMYLTGRYIKKHISRLIIMLVIPICYWTYVNNNALTIVSGANQNNASIALVAENIRNHIGNKNSEVYYLTDRKDFESRYVEVLQYFIPETPIRYIDKEEIRDIDDFKDGIIVIDENCFDLFELVPTYQILYWQNGMILLESSDILEEYVLKDEKEILLSEKQMVKGQSTVSTSEYSWESTGQEGYILYGPYIPLRKGEYEVEVEAILLDSSVPSNIVMDVYAGEILVQKEIELTRNGEKISLAFNLDEDTNNIEFRIYGYAGCNAQFKNIKLIKNM